MGSGPLKGLEGSHDLPDALGGLLSARNMRDLTSNAASRRLSESRMRANVTYGLRWQGVETRTPVPGATP
jgi:hypothetical protein